MRKRVQLIKKSIIRNRPQKGQGLVEYALILGFAALVVITIVNVMEVSIEDVFSKIAGNAPVAPPSLVNYTPPPTYTTVPTVDPLATNTPTATPTDPAIVPTSTSTTTPTPTQLPDCKGYIGYPIPGRVQMENFLCGGPSTSFAERLDDGGAGSGSYRQDVTAEGPDLIPGNGGYYMGYLANGEWVNYDVLIESSQLYDLTFRTASTNTNGKFHLEFINNGQVVNKTDAINVPNSNGSWTNLVISDMPFAQGSNQIRLVIENGGFNIDYFDAEKAVAVATATNTPVMTATNTPMPTETPTNTPAPTATQTPTSTPVPANCTTYDSDDVPQDINDYYYRGGRWRTGRTYSDIRINDSGTIADINVKNLSGTHTFFGDLDFNLEGPDGTRIRIIDQSCGDYTGAFYLNLDDNAANNLPTCPPTNGTTYRPSNSLADFNGKETKGLWELRIDDNGNEDIGTLDTWSIEICTQ